EGQRGAGHRQQGRDEAGDKAAPRLSGFLADEGGVVGEVFGDEFRMPEYRGENRMEHGAGIDRRRPRDQ
ncbi:hypothetical protein DSI41_14285, partial [Mycobacterium tuberculosis]